MALQGGVAPNNSKYPPNARHKVSGVTPGQRMTPYHHPARNRLRNPCYFLEDVFLTQLNFVALTEAQGAGLEALLAYFVVQSETKILLPLTSSFPTQIGTTRITNVWRFPDAMNTQYNIKVQNLFLKFFAIINIQFVWVFSIQKIKV